MSPSNSLSDRISIYRAAGTVVFLLVVAALVWMLDGPIPWRLVVLVGGTVIFLVGSTFNVVRAHPMYNLLTAINAVFLLGVWYIAIGSDSLFLLALTGLALLEVAVEVYNYRNGTSYLRLDLTGHTNSG